MLTTHSYVFILGAGAGKPYNFPLGDELYWDISRNAETLFFDEDLKRGVKAFSEELRQTQGASIDKYLNIDIVQKLRDTS